MLQRILIVEDDERNRKILRRIIGSGYQVLEAANGREALALLKREGESISAVLLDLLMPELDGFGVLKGMRAEPAMAAIPVIVATGSTDAAAELKALALGANDFVMKPYQPDILLHRLQNTIRLRENAAAVQTLTRDSLTGLYNREAFFVRAAQRIEAHEPGYYVLSCIDIDHFKVINDQYGTAKGDQVLRHVAGAFAKALPETECLCCRLMADQFALLYPVSLMDGEQSTRAMQEAVALEGDLPPVTISVGRYIVSDRSLSVSAMYDRASMAQSTVKGRFDVHIALYDEAMRQRLLREQRIVNGMKHALEAGQFEIWLQPQYNHASGALVGAEALVRWRDPDQGLVSPGEFVPVFERNGFIYELDKFVWEQACRLLRRWLDEGGEPLPISVNISRYDIFREDFFAALTGLVERYRIPVRLLRLEITESAFAQSDGPVIQMVERLTRYGFTIEIDDFGSGYSSLNTLKDVPASVLKLDMRFLESGANSQRGGNILESVVRMAKWLNMSVIAEGVETREQADYLRSIGCCCLQGYFYARPMPVSGYEALARRSPAGEKDSSLKTVARLDNDAFWNPASMETLIFNSYVGGACIFERHNGRSELLRVNEKYAQTLLGEGGSVEEALSIKPEEHMDPSARSRLEKAVKRADETGVEAVCELCLYGLPGRKRQRWLRVAVRVIARAGERLLLYASLIDVTAQRKAERKERETSRQLQAIMKNVGGGVSAMTVDPNGAARVVFANDQFYALFGYSRERMESEAPDPFQLIEPEDRARILRIIARMLAERRPASYEYRIRRQGAVAYLHCNAAVTSIDGVGDRVLLSNITDVTQRKENERQLLDAVEQLGFLNRASASLLAPGSAAEGIGQVLEQVLEYLGGRRAYVCEYLPGGDGLTSAYQVCAPDGQGCPRREQALLERLPLWLKRFEGQSSVYIPDVSALEKGREAQAALGLGSLIAVPLRSGEQTLGFIVVDDPSRNQRHISRLVAVGDYIAVMLTRRDLNARIEANNKMLAELMNDMPGGFVRMKQGPEGSFYISYINRGFCEMVQMEPEELTARFDGNVLNAVHPDDVEGVMAAMEDMRLNGGRLYATCRILSGAGAYLWTDVFGRLSQNSGGDTFLNLYYSDMSKRERGKLSFSEMLPVALDAVMVSSTDMTFVKDAQLRYICCSRAFAQANGFEDGKAMAGKTDGELFPGELAAAYLAPDQRLIREGTAVTDHVVRSQGPDGAVRYLSTSKYPLHDSVGNVIGLYGICRDVTGQHAAVDTLRVREEEYRLAIANSGSLVYRYLVAEKAIDISPEAAALFGHPPRVENVPESLIATGTVAQESVAVLRDFYRRIDRGDPTGSMLARRRVADGSERWFDACFSTIFDRGGKPVSAIILFKDVTEGWQERLVNALEYDQLMAALDHLSCAVASGNLTRRRYRRLCGAGRLLPGCEPEGPLEALLASLRQRIDPDRWDEFDRSFGVAPLREHFAAGGTARQMRCAVLGPDRRMHPAELAALPLEDPHGGEALCVLVCRWTEEE